MKLGGTAALAIAAVMAAGAAVTVYLRDGGDGDGFAGPAPVVEPQAAANEPAAPTAAVALPVKKVEKLEIDLVNRRVLVPGEGWLAAQAFWRLYLEEPQKLPGDIDFAMLREFEQLTRAERDLVENGGKAQ